jgi:large subunit ribosomal protein L10
MKRELKKSIIDSLTDQINESKHFYITDISELDAAATFALRKACFEKQVTLIQVKNTLLRVALEQAEGDFSELADVLKQSSSLMLTEVGNAPAKVIKELSKGKDKPALKAAFVEQAIYLGSEQLDVLCSIKSKEELIGDIISALQAPISNVMSALEADREDTAEVVETPANEE